MSHIRMSQAVTNGVIFCVFRTKRADTVPLGEQAISGRDYVAEQSSVDMFSGVDRVPVEITIKSVSFQNISKKNILVG